MKNKYKCRKNEGLILDTAPDMDLGVLSFHPWVYHHYKLWLYLQLCRVLETMKMLWWKETTVCFVDALQKGQQLGMSMSNYKEILTTSKWDQCKHMLITHFKVLASFLRMTWFSDRLWFCSPLFAILTLDLVFVLSITNQSNRTDYYFD